LTPNPDTFDCYCVVAHPAKPAFLLVEQDGAWGPPRLRSEQHWNTQQVLKVTEAVESWLGLRTTALRRLAEGADFVIYELEVHSRVAEKNVAARWYGPEQHAVKAGRDRGTDRILGEWLEEAAEGKPPDARRTWERAGWFAEADRWIDAQLERLGMERQGPTRQVKLWGFGAVMATPTRQGRVIFKASAGCGGREAAITEYLARVRPAHTIPLLACDIDRNWLLMPDFHELSYGALPRERYAEAAGIFARSSLEGGMRADELPLADLADFGLAELQRFSRAFAEQPAPVLRKQGALEKSELRELGRQVREMGERCAALSEFRIPDTLVNLDFRAGNIVAGNGLLFFDWLEAAVAHPFFNVLNFLHDLQLRESERSEAGAGRDRALAGDIREAFLGPFRDFEPEGRLNQAYSIASDVFPLVYLKRWLRNIADLEPGSCWAKRFEAQLQQFARRILAS